jgi:hypothetical protein
MPHALGIVVLGMGRSGTSAVTRMLTNAGFFAGHDDELMQATEANPTGHWENLRIWRTNEQVLTFLKGNWFDPPSNTLQIQSLPWAGSLIESDLAQIQRQAAGRPIVVKDPRIGVLMRIWETTINKYLHPIIVIRDPIEIALSLLHRDGTPVLFGLAAWELHMINVLKYLHNRSVIAVHYRQIIKSKHFASAVIAAASHYIKPDLRVHIDPSYAPQALDPRFYRHHTNKVDREKYLTHRQLELWQFLSTLPLTVNIMHLPDTLRSVSFVSRILVKCETERISGSKNAQSELGLP